MRIRRIRVALVAIGMLSGASVAWATGPDDRGASESALKEIEASPRKDVAQEMVARSRAALDRAQKLRASGDETHAKLAEGAALSWAEAARDVVRATAAEERTADLRRRALDAGASADRERALLEEGIAQTGRLRAQLDQVTKETTAPRTSSAANAPDGGAAIPKKAQKDPMKDAPAASTKDGGAK